MKKKFAITTMLFAAGMLSTLAFAGGKSSVDLGQKLFNDPILGGSANEKSCNSCHEDGKGLEHAGSNPKLSAAINKCITGAMEGTKIDGRSVDMRSLKMYVQSLSKE